MKNRERKQWTNEQANEARKQERTEKYKQEQITNQNSKQTKGSKLEKQQQHQQQKKTEQANEWMNEQGKDREEERKKERAKEWMSKRKWQTNKRTNCKNWFFEVVNKTNYLSMFDILFQSTSKFHISLNISLLADDSLWDLLASVICEIYFQWKSKQTTQNKGFYT